MTQRLGANSQLEWRDFDKHTLCLLLPIILDIMPLKLPRHIHSLDPAYRVLALFIKRLLLVQHVFFFC